MKHPFTDTESVFKQTFSQDAYRKQLAAAEYLLVLHAHEDLEATIMQLKRSFAGTYQCDTALGKPHITLAKFHQYEMLEPRIVASLKQVAATLPEFVVELKDFGSLPSHTIYINVSTKVQIVATVRAIKQAQHLMKPDKEHKPYFITEPHITLARKLLPWQFENGWLAYSHQPFSGRFTARDMLLLKRRQGNRSYQLVSSLAFKNKPAAALQGDLF